MTEETIDDVKQAYALLFTAHGAVVKERDELASRVRELEAALDDRFYGRIDLKLGAVRVSRIVTEPQCRQARDLRQGLIIEATIAIDAALSTTPESKP